jgi:hypothetical protein
MSWTGERRKGRRQPFEAQGEETGRCQRFAEFDANGFTTEFTEVGTLRAERVGGTLLG